MTPTNFGAATTLRHIEGDIRPDFAPATNSQLKELVAASGLPPAVSMTIFNRGLGTAGSTETQWKGYLAEHGSSRFLELTAEQLAHAVHQFARIGVHRELA